MHELGIMKSVLDASLAKKEEVGAARVCSVTLVVGEARNFQLEWVQRYFDLLSKGTDAEGALVAIETVPVTCHCFECGEIFAPDIHRNELMTCPQCRSREFRQLTGSEVIIKSICVG